jgi:hypothetical protein
VELVAARLGDDADLASGISARFRRIIVGFHSKFEDVLGAALQTKRGGEFAADDSGSGTSLRPCSGCLQTELTIIDISTANNTIRYGFFRKEYPLLALLKRFLFSP